MSLKMIRSENIESPRSSYPHYRKEDRRPLSMNVVIYTEGAEPFRTFTKDISSCGLQLRDPLPENFVGRTLKFILPMDETGADLPDIAYGKIVGDDRVHIHLISRTEMYYAETLDQDLDSMS